MGSLWVVVGRCGSLWIVVGRCGSLWIVVDRCGSLWVVVGHCGSFRVLVTTGPRAALWPFYGFLCKRLSLYIKVQPFT